MKKRNILLAFCLAFCVIVTGCSAKDEEDKENNTQSSQTQSVSYTGELAFRNVKKTINLKDNETTVEGQGVSVTDNIVTITQGGEYTLTGSLSNGTVVVNTEEKVALCLKGVSITSEDNPAIFVEDADICYLTLVEGTENALADQNPYVLDAKGTLFSNDTLIIEGQGSLTVDGKVNHTIVSDDDIVVESGTLTLTAAKDGLHANDNITVNGGDITIDCVSDGLESEADMIINGGTFSIKAGDDGMHAATELTVNGGTIDVTDSYEGLEAKTVLTVNKGDIHIKAEDDGFNAGTDMVINDGYIYVYCDGDGFDSNGNMTINGGTSLIHGGLQGDGPLDIGDGGNYTFTMNGGTVIAAGGNMAISVSETSKQKGVWIGGSLQTDTIVNIKGENGVLETFQLDKGASAIFVSTPEIETGKTYNVSTGGTATGEKKDSVYTDKTYSGGTELGSFTADNVASSVGSVMMGMGGPGGGMGGAGFSGNENPPNERGQARQPD